MTGSAMKSRVGTTDSSREKGHSRTLHPAA
jgi:hypothetical protein